MRRRFNGLLIMAIGTAIAVPAFGVTSASASPARQQAWWVQAGAPSGGTGSTGHPFNSLAAVQAASKPGDTIYVLPAPGAAGPLNGGIALKPDQRLIGLGGPVTKLPNGSPKPYVANTTSQNNGDAITVASSDIVRNVAVTAAVRGGIYGNGASGVSITGNDITGTNSSCQAGLLIYFPVALNPAGLTNGWAAIMLDEAQGPSTGSISGNRVHDEVCADGIDIRASGTARSSVRIDGNDVTALQQGPAVKSVLAIGFQTRDSARLNATIDGNSETYIGSSGADCEGIFTNQTGASLLNLAVDRNTFAHGIGGASCNGLEAFVGRDSASESVDVENSSFTDDPGDMIEENNLGTGSFMDLRMNHVTISHTTISNPEVTTPDPSFGQLTGHGDCVNQFTTGAQATSTLEVTGSSITDCGNDGVFAFANTPSTAAASATRIILADTRLADAGNDGFHWVNYAAIGDVQISISHDLFTGNKNADARFDAAAGATTGRSAVNLGTSAGTGCNSFLSEPLSLETTGYDVSARYDWWGQPVPSASQVSTSAGGVVATAPSLRSPC